MFFYLFFFFIILVEPFTALFIGLDYILNWPHSTLLVLHAHITCIYMHARGTCTRAYRDLGPPLCAASLFFLYSKECLRGDATLPATCFENSKSSTVYGGSRCSGGEQKNKKKTCLKGSDYLNFHRPQ